MVVVVVVVVVVVAAASASAAAAAAAAAAAVVVKFKYSECRLFTDSVPSQTCMHSCTHRVIFRLLLL